MSEYACSRPFWEILQDGRIFDWVACPYTIGGLGLTGFGAFILAAGFIGLFNWSESWIVPMTWLGIMGPAMAFMLPGALIRQLAGLITVAVLMIFVGLYWWWGRS